MACRSRPSARRGARSTTHRPLMAAAELWLGSPELGQQQGSESSPMPLVSVSVCYSSSSTWRGPQGPALLLGSQSMPQGSTRLRSTAEGRWEYWCQGCKEIHRIGPSWEFNGNVESPTFARSVLVTSGHYAPGWTGPSCWCTYKKEHPDCEFECSRCHTFIRNGMVEFLSDCTHELAGQTLPLPEIPETE